jgi:hypothetical protein
VLGSESPIILQQSSSKKLKTDEILRGNLHTSISLYVCKDPTPIQNDWVLDLCLLWISRVAGYWGGYWGGYKMLSASLPSIAAIMNIHSYAEFIPHFDKRPYMPEAKHGVEVLEVMFTLTPVIFNRSGLMRLGALSDSPQFVDKVSAYLCEPAAGRLLIPLG